MNIEQELIERSNSSCELCGSPKDLQVLEVAPSDNTAHTSIYVCAICKEQIENPDKTDANHWRCLNDSAWSPVPAVQVMAYRMLHRLKGEGWPQDLLDTMYMDDETRTWAEKGVAAEETEGAVVHKDSNGATLATGDTVVLIKDLDVKGGGFTAKRGTAVRNIRLVDNNPEHIEGKVNGQQIVILTKFVKKSN